MKYLIRYFKKCLSLQREYHNYGSFFVPLTKKYYFCRKIWVMDVQLIQQVQSYFATQPVLKAWLFGSYARGEQTPDSDVDILVVFDQEDGKRVSLLKHIGIALGLEDLLGKKVDLITEGTLLPFAQETAEKDKVLIYERAS